MPGITELHTPLAADAARRLAAGDRILLSGPILTARDAAHKRLCELIARGERLPVDLVDQVMYFVGPTPARPGRVIGAAGPTTSSRMDPYSPKLLARGLRGMIGKGRRSPALRAALREFSAVHFAAVGGLGALLARCVQSAEVLAYEDLGTEAVRRLVVVRMPLIVAYDAHGRSVYPQDDEAPVP